MSFSPSELGAKLARALGSKACTPRMRNARASSGIFGLTATGLCR